MQHLYWDLGSVAFGAQFEVELRGSAYLDKDAYEYHGGFFDSSPVVLEVPYDDWYLVVDSYGGKVKVWVSQLFD
ncbi:DUF1883 domain-containing protein [Nonomuraea sp. NPDC055795]